MSYSLETRVAMLERQIADMKRLMGTPFALAQSTLLPKDSGVVQTVQLKLDPLSVRDDVPVLYDYGFTGMPPIGANFHICYLDGQRSKAVAIASGHQTHRLRGLGEGDSAQYDMRGAFFRLSATGPQLNGAGNPTLITGDLHVTGAVIAGFGGGQQVSLQTHRTTDVQAGSGISGPPEPGT